MNSHAAIRNLGDADTFVEVGAESPDRSRASLRSAIYLHPVGNCQHKMRSRALLGGCVKLAVCVYFICVTLLVSTPPLPIEIVESMILLGYAYANTNKEVDDERPF